MDYLPDNAPTFSSLVGQADERLFRSIELNPSHVLRDLLPPIKHTNSGPEHMIMFSLSRMLTTLSRATYTSSR